MEGGGGGAVAPASPMLLFAATGVAGTGDGGRRVRCGDGVNGSVRVIRRLFPPSPPAGCEEGTGWLLLMADRTPSLCSPTCPPS
eukprot:COSAG05_NODE_416_length_10031_cov_18.951067_7_plen_84_part_00